ncbi:MAG: ion transporter [Bacteroidales bacterium]|nr:ion transporter [Bacteroidales bacterium]
MIKQKIYGLIEKGSHGSKLNLRFDYVVMILIVLNIIAMILETIPNINDPLDHFFRIFEIASIIFFSIEYILRIYVSNLTHPSSNRIKSALKFIFSAYGLIDLFAIAPFYLPFIIKIDLRFIRILRIFRFMRILKINRYSNSINIIWTVIKEKKSELAITGFITILVLLTSSFLMYYIEGKAQPNKFPNIISSLWWAVATLTTVGYGDVYPVTGLGKFISALIAICGIGLVALPTGIISSGFMKKINKPNTSTNKCPHCGKEIS